MEEKPYSLSTTSTSTSRLIVKNLPNKITVEKLKDDCGKLGQVTDCQLKFTPSGKFRRFAFVGFRTVEEAEAAKNYLHNTFIGSARIQVEFCQPLNESTSRSKKKVEKDNIENTAKNKADPSSDYVQIIIENLPRNVKKKTVRNFITPVKPIRIDICNGVTGRAEIKLQKKSDAKTLQKLDGRYFGGQKIFIKLTESSGDTEAASYIPPSEITNLKDQSEAIHETGRLFVRNIPYACTLNDVQQAFEKFGPLADMKLPLDPDSKQHKGYAIVSYVLPENALRAFTEMDGTVFYGRMLHLVPGEESKEDKKAVMHDEAKQGTSYKAKKAREMSTTASRGHNWNTFFLAANAVADVLVEKLGAEKQQILDAKSKSSLGVRMALGETQLVRECREFLTKNGVSLESFNDMSQRRKRSTTVILVKNLPAKTTSDELRLLFSKHGEICRLILPPNGISALIEFMQEQHAKKAFSSLAYKKFKSAPLYLEWASADVFNSTEAPAVESLPSTDSGNDTDGKPSSVPVTADSETSGTGIPPEPEPQTTLFVKNLHFSTTDQQLHDHFSRVGPLKYATAAKKKSKNGSLLSMGYGFVQFMRKSDAFNALKLLQRKELDGFMLELKLSDRMDSEATASKRKRKSENATGDDKNGGNASETKLLVKNVPFQADKKELDALFRTFGELRGVRLPRKTGGDNSHRGFAFVDYVNKVDAKKAFEALSHSTHLYGRRLVITWADDDQSLDDLRAKIADFDSTTNQKRRKRVELSSDFSISVHKAD